MITVACAWVLVGGVIGLLFVAYQRFYEWATYRWFQNLNAPDGLDWGGSFTCLVFAPIMSIILIGVGVSVIVEWYHETVKELERAPMAVRTKKS